jgi:CMP-N,N'-diacetyllegionaminic acid synthase
VSILAIIPARGGSRRIPRKNIKILGDRPLISWSIDVAHANRDIADVLVSTDDEEIASVARASGALVPWLRPATLATDTASSVDVCLHAVDWYESCHGKVDGILLLQPTSPFRRLESIARGLALFREHGGSPVLAVAPAASHPLWCYRLNGLKMQPYLGADGIALRSQDLPPVYSLTGALYLIRPDDLRQHRSFQTKDAIALVIDNPLECVDIDTEWDWQVADALLKQGLVSFQ